MKKSTLFSNRQRIRK